MSLYDISYINLEHRSDRRQVMEHRLNQFYQAHEYQRFQARTGDDRECRITKNELGCFLSHQAVIENSSEEVYTLVLEDDVLLASNFRDIVDGIVSVLPQRSPDWDIIFLSQMVDIGNVAASYRLLNLKKKFNDDPSRKNFSIMDAKAFYASSCASYLINPRSKSKIAGILQSYAKNNYPVAIDLCLKNELAKGNLLCAFIFPYLTGLDNKNDSSIQSSEKQQISHLLEDNLNIFFVDADWKGLLEKYQPNQAMIENNKEQYLASQILFRRFMV